METAMWEQMWKKNVSDIFGRYSGNAERAVYMKFADIDFGVPRRPQTAMDPSQMENLFADLEKFDFFSRAYPLNASLSQ